MTKLRCDIPVWILDACAVAQLPPTDLKLYSVKLPNLYTDKDMAITLVARDERRFVVSLPWWLAQGQPISAQCPESLVEV